MQMQNQNPKEAEIVINGVYLTFAQSMTIRVAVAHMLTDLSDPEYMKDMGEIGELYRKRLREIQDMIFLNLNT